MRSHPLLIIPVETKARELHSKLLLACTAAESGYRVVLGRLRPSQLATMERGVILDKSVANNRVNRFKRFRKLGHRVVAWDEEGLNFYETFYRNRVDYQALSQVEQFYCWGHHQASFLKSTLPGELDRLHVTGNPRIDLLRPELRNWFRRESEEIRSRYGRFVLLNSKFGASNHAARSPAELENQLRTYGIVKTDVEKDFLRDLIAYDAEMMAYFIEALPVIAEAAGDLRLIIRPHPAEDQSPWRAAASRIENAEVVYEGGVAAWILAAEMVVHNSCTTGMEAYLLDRPVISYQPIKSPEFDLDLPDTLSIQVDSLEWLAKTVKRVLAEGREDSENRRALLRSHVSAVDGALSSERIVALLGELEVDISEDRWKGAKAALGTLERIWYRFRATLYDLRRGDKQARYSQQKFDALSLSEVEQLVRELVETTGRFQEVAVRELFANCFQLCSEYRGEDRSPGHL